ncbi:MAG: hypothetical protein H6672_12305 [Anaerolineaceae bacterium]|nr:hypothetical protein [Anaerolineaceae bacterium]
MSEDHRDESSGTEMKIDIGQISAAGNVVIAGRDAYVTGSTHGDGSEKHILTVGGVEASAEEAQELRQLLHQIDEKIENAKLDPAAQDAARHNASTLKEQLSSQAKPNEHLLVQAAEALLNYGPDIAGAVVTVLTTPLAGQITAFAGKRAMELYRRLRTSGTGISQEA